MSLPGANLGADLRRRKVTGPSYADFFVHSWYFCGMIRVAQVMSKWNADLDTNRFWFADSNIWLKAMISVQWAWMVEEETCVRLFVTRNRWFRNLSIAIDCSHRAQLSPGSPYTHECPFVSLINADSWAAITVDDKWGIQMLLDEKWVLKWAGYLVIIYYLYASKSNVSCIKGWPTATTSVLTASLFSSTGKRFQHLHRQEPDNSLNQKSWDIGVVVATIW